MDKTNTVLIGGTGMAASAIENSVATYTIDYNHLASTLVQLVIAIVTLISLFRTNKNKV